MYEKEKTLFLKNEDLTPKLNLCYYSTLINSEGYYVNDSIIKLISNFKEIQLIQSMNYPDFFKFLYFNRIKIHYILYFDQAFITINEINNTIKNYFYLSLLLLENKYIVNYIYSIEFIKQINQLQTKEKKQKLKILIMAKTMSDIISNYKLNNDNNDEKELETIIKYNNKIIDENINILKEFNIEKKDISNTKIDIIYVQIINYLIINKKLDESDYTIDLIKQVDSESIYLTKTILDNLIKILDINKDYLKEYIITKYEDLFNEKTITFYYVLLKYIIKSNFLVYHIPFLYKTRNNILRIINDNILKFYNIKKNKNYLMNKIKYVLNEFIISLEYYIEKSSKLMKELSNSNVKYSRGNISALSSERSNDTDKLNVFEWSSVKKKRKKILGEILKIMKKSLYINMNLKNY